MDELPGQFICPDCDRPILAGAEMLLLAGKMRHVACPMVTDSPPPVAPAAPVGVPPTSRLHGMA
jgi:hypothetical protein